MKRVHVCTHITRDGKTCPELQPCPTHTRPANAAWSTDRDHAEHMRLRRTVIKQRGARCERCGWTAENNRGKGLQMHHVRPGNTPANVVLLCGPLGNNCHRAVDSHAR